MCDALVFRGINLSGKSIWIKPKMMENNKINTKILIMTPALYVAVTYYTGVSAAENRPPPINFDPAEPQAD